MKKIEEADQLRAQLQAQFSHVESLHQPIGMQQGSRIKREFLKFETLTNLSTYYLVGVGEWVSLVGKSRVHKVLQLKTVPCVVNIRRVDCVTPRPPLTKRHLLVS